MSGYKSINDYPDFSFVEDMELEDAVNQMIAWYEEAYEDLTGDKITLQDADPERLRLETIAYMYYQCLMYIDFVGKQNTLKYSVDNFLDALGAAHGLQRKEATTASCTVRFKLSAERDSDYIIPQGTRCTSGDDVFFYTAEEESIPKGELQKDILCYCTLAGIEGNEYEVGEIDTLVDSLPYIESVTNIEHSHDGSDEETDDEFAERIFLHPASYSTAGTEDSYIYHVKEANREIEDVEVTSKEPCEVTIRFAMTGGVVPNEETLQEVTEYLSQKDKKVLGDKVTIEKPSTVLYDIDFVYYIAETDKKAQKQIMNAVEEAVEEYKKWQSSKIARDINPSELMKLVMGAGAKRLVINQPMYSKTAEGTLPLARNMNVEFGGVESD